MSHSDKRLTAEREFIFPENKTADDSPLLRSMRSASQGEAPSPLRSFLNIQKQKLLVSGQGVLIFRLKDALTESFTTEVSLRTENGADSLQLTLGLNTLQLYRSKGEVRTLLTERSTGLVSDAHAFYWISLDSHNRELWFGIGEARKETRVFSYAFEKSEQRSFLELITVYDFDAAGIQPMRLLRDPIIDSVPLVVKSMDELTMDAVAANTVMPKANLSPIGQKLYENVAGSHFTLNDKGFPEFAEAIEYSIRTKGCWCYNKIEEKREKQPAQHKNRVYLRITLGRNGGESPGSPYVLEIWPPASYSSQHSHAGANALIRVLHGEISVKLFPYLAAKKEFGTATFVKDDVTWISPVLNQFHVLQNPHAQGPSCITIQCYMYDQDDSGHYDFFDYVDDEDKIQQFDPNSDMDFSEFKAQVKKEWEARPK